MEEGAAQRGKHKANRVYMLYYISLFIASFGGVRRLYLAGKRVNNNITISDVEKFLHSQKAYALFRKRRTKFSRNRFITPGILNNLSLSVLRVFCYF